MTEKKWLKIVNEFNKEAKRTIPLYDSMADWVIVERDAIEDLQHAHRKWEQSK